jgi:hypothetical protein
VTALPPISDLAQSRQHDVVDGCIQTENGMGMGEHIVDRSRVQSLGGCHDLSGERRG